MATPGSMPRPSSATSIKTASRVACTRTPTSSLEPLWRSALRQPHGGQSGCPRSCRGRSGPPKIRRARQRRSARLHASIGTAMRSSFKSSLHAAPPQLRPSPLDRRTRFWAAPSGSMLGDPGWKPEAGIRGECLSSEMIPSVAGSASVRREGATPEAPSQAPQAARAGLGRLMPSELRDLELREVRASSFRSSRPMPPQRGRRQSI